MENFNYSFGLRLGDEMDRKGFESQKEFANQIGVSDVMVGKYLNGITTPKADTLKKICDTLDVSCDYLLGITSEKSTNVELKDISKKLNISVKALSSLSTISKTNNSTINYLLENIEWFDLIYCIENLLNSNNLKISIEDETNNIDLTDLITVESPQESVKYTIYRMLENRLDDLLFKHSNQNKELLEKQLLDLQSEKNKSIYDENDKIYLEKEIASINNKLAKLRELEIEQKEWELSITDIINND